MKTTKTKRKTKKLGLVTITQVGRSIVIEGTNWFPEPAAFKPYKGKVLVMDIKSKKSKVKGKLTVTHSASKTMLRFPTAKLAKKCHLDMIEGACDVDEIPNPVDFRSAAIDKAFSSALK